MHAQYYEKAYGERNDREGVYFQSVSNGYIIAGTALDTTYNTRGYYILKIDKRGQKVWEKQYSDAFSAYTYGLTVLDNGNIAIVGTHAGIFILHLPKFYCSIQWVIFWVLRLIHHWMDGEQVE